MRVLISEANITKDLHLCTPAGSPSMRTSLSCEGAHTPAIDLGPAVDSLKVAG